MAKKKTEVIEIKPIKIERFKVKVVGDSPIIFHKWTTKAMIELEGRTPVRRDKEKPTPEECFIESMYWMSEKPEEYTLESYYELAEKGGVKVGFPASAFKMAANSTAYRMGLVENQMGLRGTFFIEADDDRDLVEIQGDVPKMRRDLVRIGSGSPDIRYRGQMDNWFAVLTITYNANSQYTKKDIVNFLNAGGFCCGLGEWRPERDGKFGMFHVEAV